MIKAENVILEKSYVFALRLVKAYKYLTEEEREFTLSKQLLEWGTSVSANIAKAFVAQTPKDFLAKLDVSHEVAEKTMHCLRLLKESNKLNEK